MSLFTSTCITLRKQGKKVFHFFYKTIFFQIVIVNGFQALVVCTVTYFINKATDGYFLCGLLTSINLLHLSLKTGWTNGFIATGNLIKFLHIMGQCTMYIIYRYNKDSRNSSMYLGNQLLKEKTLDNSNCCK